MANRLDAFWSIELAAESADVYVDDIASWIKGQPPDVGEQLVAAARLAGAGHEVLQQTELAQR
jgi:hypothetical protein